MNEERRHKARRELADAIAKRWADEGQLVEGGWQAFAHMALADCGPLQLAEMRKAFFLGAQHVFASILNTLDPGKEASEADLTRMSALHRELEGFRLAMMAEKPPKAGG